MFGLTVSLTFISIIVAESYQKKYKLHDPQWIVIDEVLGMLIAWSFYPDFSATTLIILFILFRIFDISKPWPASYFDRMTHGAGTILDDIVCGIYVGIILSLLNYFHMLAYIPSIFDKL